MKLMPQQEKKAHLPTGNPKTPNPEK